MARGFTPYIMQLKLSPARVLLRPQLKGFILGEYVANMTSSWFNSYHRKLRAMKAGKEARKTPVEAMTSTVAIPGTNMYNTER